MKKNSLNNIRKEMQKSHLLLIVIITICLSIGGALININASNQNFDQNLINTSTLISHLYEFTKKLSGDELCKYFNNVTKELPSVDVISIVDKNNIRLYHTNNSLIGTFYDGRIPDFKNADTSVHIFNETGPSGPQHRTYTAIYDENQNYSGFIMTIILKTSIRVVTLKTILLFVIVTLFAILIEILISKTLSHKIKQKLYGYEPDTFSLMYTIRENILESINEGIISINFTNCTDEKKLKIEYMNKAAKKVLSNLQDEKLNQIKQNVFIQKFFLQMYKNSFFSTNNEKSIFGLHEKTEDGIELLIDLIPVITEEKKVSGAVAILHDRTEYTHLIEDLAGTKYLVDSMRANNHDFTNKLHVILGLIQIGQYNKAISYIENISIIQRETLSGVMNSIDNPSFAALLIGKIARASECNVKFILLENTHFSDCDIQLPSEALVTIVGNLIDNALDSMNQSSSSIIQKDFINHELRFGAFSKKGELMITVQDNGCGIKKENYDKVFENGFSTKGKNRGVGLFHTKQLVQSLGGEISFESQENFGTRFMVKFLNV